MTDISKCSDKRCPSRTLCYRFTAPSEPRYQSFGAFGRKAGQKKCEDFWDNAVSDKCQNGAINETETISMERYSNMIDEIAAKGKPVADTLIEMLELASRFKVLVKKHMIPAGNGRKVSELRNNALRKKDNRRKNVRKTR